MMAVGLRSRLHNIRVVYRRFKALVEHGITIPRRSEMERLRAQHDSNGDRLARSGYKIYSQHEEDGMIAEIFRRIGCRSHYFIEFGVGDGLENNTLALLMQEWKGIWLEADAECCRRILEGLPETIGSGQLAIKHALITRENIDALITGHNPPEEIDLLSIDIDGNDFHVWEQIRSVKARVVVIEYNPKFPPPIEYCMEYDASHQWDLSDHCGASLAFLERRFRARDYSLVACDVTGNNAFFVRSNLAETHFQGPFTARAKYEPARFDLVSIPSGHPPSYRTIERRLRLQKSVGSPETE
jgi:hypothetical protein